MASTCSRLRAVTSEYAPCGSTPHIFGFRAWLPEIAANAKLSGQHYERRWHIGARWTQAKRPRPWPSAILLVASLRNQSSSDGGPGGWAVICSWFGATIAIAAGPDSNPIAVNAGHRFSDLPLRQNKPRSAGMAALPLPSRANRVACRQPQGLLLPLAWLRARA